MSKTSAILKEKERSCGIGKNCFFINQSCVKEIISLPGFLIQFIDISALLCNFHCATDWVPQSFSPPAARELSNVWNGARKTSWLSYRYFLYTFLRKYIYDLNIYEVLCWILNLILSSSNPVSVFWLHTVRETMTNYLKGRDGIIWFVKDSD